LSIESYGGNPDIVASKNEIQRISYELKLAAIELSEASPLSGLLEDPLQYLRFRIEAASLVHSIERLQGLCLIAIEEYFTAEARVQRRFELGFIPELSRIVLLAGSAWKLDDSVKAELKLTTETNQPKAITEMLDRLWRLSSKKEPTIGIEIFEGANNRKVFVYIPGTQAFISSTNPLDMESNVRAMAGPDRALSEKAVVLAMREAGITASDEVVFIGHSQGGMLAGNLVVNSVGYLPVGLVAIGAPLAQLSIKKVPVLAIEHVNDPVPNLSGKVNPLKSNWVTVQRKSLSTESDALIHSHSLKSYRNTTTEIDASKDKSISSIRNQILEANFNRKGKYFEYVISK
jgi:hypothetical protein